MLKKITRAIGSYMWWKFGEIIHNCIIHPFLPFLPRRVADYIHDNHARMIGLE